jgi:hypothetical protein
MLRKDLVVVAAAALMASMVSIAPADAAKKGKKRSPASVPASTSLDGRTLGYPRTCGFDYYLYDDLGAPMGPYCH